MPRLLLVVPGWHQGTRLHCCKADPQQPAVAPLAKVQLAGLVCRSPVAVSEGTAGPCLQVAVCSCLCLHLLLQLLQHRQQVPVVLHLHQHLLPLAMLLVLLHLDRLLHLRHHLLWLVLQVGLVAVLLLLGALCCTLAPTPSGSRQGRTW